MKTSAGRLGIALAALAILGLAALFALVRSAPAGRPASISSDSHNPTRMQITSSAFGEGETIPEEFTCRGEGKNPPLEISGVPGEAVSLALVVDDPDAPSGDFVHWAMWNVPRDTAAIDTGVPPEQATQGQNGAGRAGWVPPCPPSGTHHYHFKLYALDRNLELDETAGKADLQAEMNGHIIDQAELVGLVSAQ